MDIDFAIGLLKFEANMYTHFPDSNYRFMSFNFITEAHVLSIAVLNVSERILPHS